MLLSIGREATQTKLASFRDGLAAALGNTLLQPAPRARARRIARCRITRDCLSGSIPLVIAVFAFSVFLNTTPCVRPAEVSKYTCIAVRLMRATCGGL